MTPEAKAREAIDQKLEQAGWVVQDLKQLNLSAGVGVAVRPAAGVAVGVVAVLVAVGVARAFAPMGTTSR